MTCACVLNAEETQVVVPCLLHAKWAKTVAAQTWGDGPMRPPMRTLEQVRAMEERRR